LVTPDLNNNKKISWLNSPKKIFCLVRLEVLTLAVMNSSIFWDIRPCCSFKVNRCFGGTSHRHLHGRRISQATYLPNAGFLFGLFFVPEDEGDMFPRNVG
jgi:hypothetical protein